VFQSNQKGKYIKFSKEILWDFISYGTISKHVALSYTEMSSSGKIVPVDVTNRMFPSALEAVFDIYPTDACLLT